MHELNDDGLIAEAPRSFCAIEGTDIRLTLLPVTGGAQLGQADVIVAADACEGDLPDS